MRIGLNTIINLLNILGIPLLVVYFVCMVIYPFLQGNWAHVHSVWHSWQTVNMGVLALLSSFIAFNISRYHVEEQRKRELIAATSFLSQALSDLSSYLTGCANILSQGWDKTTNEGFVSRESFQGEMESLNSSVKQVFSECIRHGDSDLANHLAKILSKFQINNARMLGLSANTSLGSSMIISRLTIQARVFDVAELQVLVNATFSFARQQENSISPKMGLDEFNSAYASLELKSEIIYGMQEFTKHRLK
jgi:hypothetical protein